jgi:hypothetical protein
MCSKKGQDQVLIKEWKLRYSLLSKLNHTTGAAALQAEKKKFRKYQGALS